MPLCPGDALSQVIPLVLGSAGGMGATLAPVCHLALGATLAMSGTGAAW